MEDLFTIVEALDKNYSSAETTWVRGELIRKGTGGLIYKTSSKSSKGNFVLKIGPSTLFSEQTFYKQLLKPVQLRQAELALGYQIYLPSFIDAGTKAYKPTERGEKVQKIFWLVTDELMPYNPKLPLADKEFKKLCLDILGALAYLALYDRTHGDIKLPNICQKAGNFYLLNFDFVTMVKGRTEVRGLNRAKYVEGTIEYAGRDMHIKGHGPSFRADLENLIFCALEWAGYTLPWKDFGERVAEIAIQKSKLLTGKFSLKSTPYKTGVINRLIAYANKMEFRDKWDFQYVRQIFTSDYSQPHHESLSEQLEESRVNVPLDIDEVTNETDSEYFDSTASEYFDSTASEYVASSESPSDDEPIGKPLKTVDWDQLMRIKPNEIVLIGGEKFLVLPPETPTNKMEPYVYDPGEDRLLNIYDRPVKKIPQAPFTLNILSNLLLLKHVVGICSCGGLEKVKQTALNSTDPSVQQAINILSKRKLF